MTQRRAKVIRPTKLEVRPVLIDAFADLGVPASAWPEIVEREQNKGTTQADFDDALEKELETGRDRQVAARIANEEDEAKRKAAELQATRQALAGMAMQGLLSNVSLRPTDEVGLLAVEYADALLAALDTTEEDS